MSFQLITVALYSRCRQYSRIAQVDEPATRAPGFTAPPWRSPPSAHDGEFRERSYGR